MFLLTLYPEFHVYAVIVNQCLAPIAGFAAKPHMAEAIEKSLMAPVLSGRKAPVFDVTGRITE